MFLCSWSCFGVTVANHNIVHVPIFHNRHLNSLMNVILTLSFGHPSSTYVPGHNLSHHKHTQTKKDFMRTTKVNQKWNALNLVVFFYLIAQDTMKNDWKYFRAQRKLNRPIWKQVRLEIIALLLCHGILVISDIKKYLIYVYLSQLFAKYAITTMNLLQHDGCLQQFTEEGKHNHSRNFTGSFLNFWAMNNGYHAAHHLYPGIHWSELPKVHKEKVEPFTHPNLNQSDIGSYLYDAYVSPGVRKNFDGSEYKWEEPGEDEDWFYDQTETHSDEKVKYL
jgi:fatty acid desaturase